MLSLTRFLVLLAGLLPTCSSFADELSQLEFHVRENGKRIPCRIHLRNAKGEPQRPKGVPFFRDHFVCPGNVRLEVPPGKYFFDVERGPEYESQTAFVEIREGKPQSLNITMKRIANLRNEGWYSGDMHIHRPLEDIELLMRAEDLDFGPVITWWNNRNLWKDQPIPENLTRKFDGHRLYDVLAGEDEREGGALLYYGLKQPLPLAGSMREVPSPMKFVELARSRRANVWIDIEKPFWWDVPVWLASGQANSIGLANNHMCRSRMYESEAWGRPRDTKRLPAPRGNGFWTQEIYYQILNAGLRLPPSAGSASGVLPNPVGYNRVYVHLDKPFTRSAWFDGLAKGRCFVTNGPLLRVKSDGRYPGEVIRLDPDEKRNVTLDIELTSRDPISHLEVVQNGTVIKAIACTRATSQHHRAKVVLDGPGWFLVRAIAKVDKTFRFGSTAPWYVEQGDVRHRVSRRSARFFLDWVEQRIERVENNVKEETKRSAVLRWHEQARTFWAKRVREANAE